MFTFGSMKSLKNSLDYEKLQQLFNEISDKNTALQNEAEKTKTELNTLRVRTEAAESSKRELELKCASLTNQEKQLHEVIGVATEETEKLLTEYNSLERILEEERESSISQANKHQNTYIEWCRELEGAKEEKKSLETSLNDTKYQLQYLLSDVQRRNPPVPSVLRDSAELLTAVQVSPNIPHDQLVFKDVAELQDLNTKLVSDVKNLKEQVKYASNEVSHVNTQRNNDVKIFTNALNEAEQNIQSLSSTSEDLQKELNAMSTEYSAYRELMRQLGEDDGDVYAIFENMKQIYEKEHKKIVEYCDEAEDKNNKLKNQIIVANNASNNSKIKLRRAIVAIDKLRREKFDLSSRAKQRRKKLQVLLNENYSLYSQLEVAKQALKKEEKVAKNFKNKRGGRITKSNNRNFRAVKFKKKFIEAEKKISGFESTETATATTNNHIDNSLKVVKEKETLEEEKKKVEELNSTPVENLEDTLNGEEEELSDTPRGKKHEREDNEERVIVYPLAKKVKI